MFKKILIANRGEIAVRIIRACKEMGIKSVAVYSDVDRPSLHVQLADEAFCIGPAPSLESYLNIPNLMSTALIAQVQAVHPGYGFLAENTYFVDICKSHELKFIGPSKEVMALMGDKAKARQVVAQAGVKVLPGTGILEDEDEALSSAKSIGFPVILKATAGGGGKGMRIAYTKDDLLKNFLPACQEAKAAFGDGRVYLEKYSPGLKHVEVQILADEHGNAIALGERDCSIQRRHQKLVEESPCPAVSPELRERLGLEAIKVVQAVGYTNAGTVEFLFDPAAGEFYFIEMNTRIQVEHPVTEMVTGFDLIKAQIAMACGEKLQYQQSDLPVQGHSIECRINAEDHEAGFVPSSGRVSALQMPGGPGVRVDTFITPGCDILPFYDSLVAKLITWGRDRQEARQRMRRALEEFKLEGIKTTLPFLKHIINSDLFSNGTILTTSLEKELLKA